MREPLGLILAGGLGVRMGGMLKADVVLGGQSLFTQTLARLEPQVEQVAVNANAPIRTSLPVLPDASPDHLGPLAGVLAGLNWAIKEHASHIVTVAVDTPFFPCNLVPNLFMAGLKHPDGFAIAATSDGLQGTFGLWPVTLRDPLAAFLADGHRKVRAFIKANDAAIAMFPDTTPPSFFNINTPDDLTAAEHWV